MDKSDLSARILEFGETVIRYDLDKERSACDFTVLVVDFTITSIDSSAFNTCFNSNEHANSKNSNDLFFGEFDLVSNIAYIKTSGLYRNDVILVSGEIEIKNHLFDSQERTLLLNYSLLIDVTQLLLGIKCRKTNDTILLRIKTLTKYENNLEMVHNDSNMKNIILLTENKECFRMNL